MENNTHLLLLEKQGEVEKTLAHPTCYEIRPEISISMLNYAAGKKWKRLVAWFPSCRAKNYRKRRTQLFVFMLPNKF